MLKFEKLKKKYIYIYATATLDNLVVGMSYRNEIRLHFNGKLQLFALFKS